MLTISLRQLDVDGNGYFTRVPYTHDVTTTDKELFCKLTKLNFRSSTCIDFQTAMFIFQKIQGKLPAIDDILAQMKNHITTGREYIWVIDDENILITGENDTTIDFKSTNEQIINSNRKTEIKRRKLI